MLKGVLLLDWLAKIVTRVVRGRVCAPEALNGARFGRSFSTGQFKRKNRKGVNVAP